jgi:hypothetical protein
VPNCQTREEEEKILALETAVTERVSETMLSRFVRCAPATPKVFANPGTLQPWQV